MSTVHVVPIDDLREHVETACCWCAPRVECVDGDPEAIVIVHASADGRELVEAHGVN